MSNMDDVASHLDANQNDQSDHETTALVLNERAKKSRRKTSRRPFIFFHKRLVSVSQKSRLESLGK